MAGEPAYELNQRRYIGVHLWIYPPLRSWVPEDRDNRQGPEYLVDGEFDSAYLEPTGQLDSKVKSAAYGSCYTKLYSLDDKYTQSQRKCDHTEKGVNHF